MKKIKMNETLLAIIISIVALFSFIFIFTDQNNNVAEQDNTTYITLEDLYLEEENNKNSNSDPRSELCDNYEDLEVFENPIPIVWTAEFTGCLQSCEGAHFNRLPKDAEYEYPRFSAYMREGILPEIFREEGLILKIYGEWAMVDADHPFSVFGDKCVPIIDIDKIETHSEIIPLSKF